MVKKQIYLAGPYGFSEIGTSGIQKLKEKLLKSFNIKDPFVESPELSMKIVEIENDQTLNFNEMKQKLKKINEKIGRNNADLIKNSDFILANLDGADVDSGTAAEIGFAYAIGKKVYGYRNDFRYSCDNLGSKVNLQVEYFIFESGGKIFTSFQEIYEFFGV